MRIFGVGIFVAVALSTIDAYAEPADPDNVPERPRIYSPYVERTVSNASLAEGVYWGDTHLHTSYSTDAGMLGNTLGPETAYRFARGEEVLSAAGMRARLIRPLDFLVVADHAENLGLAPMIAESNPELLKVPWGRLVHDMVKSGDGRGAFQQWLADAVTVAKDPINNSKMMRTVWDREIAFAEQFNEPGRFTAFIGFEWSSIASQETPGNLHRVVIFKDGANKVEQVLPFSAADSTDPEKLWEYLTAYEEKTGGSVLAIAHNGNVSNGQMFPIERMNGRRVDKRYAETRMRWEPLYEVTQMKGDGEAHPFLSPNDEFADYGTWDKGDIAGLKPKEDWMLKYEYARSALQVGLDLEEKLGANPYKFGMIGSTDAHTSLATTRDENSWSKTPTMEPSADRWEHIVIASVAGDDRLRHPRGRPGGLEQLEGPASAQALLGYPRLPDRRL